MKTIFSALTRLIVASLLAIGIIALVAQLPVPATALAYAEKSGFRTPSGFHTQSQESPQLTEEVRDSEQTSIVIGQLIQEQFVAALEDVPPAITEWFQEGPGTSGKSPLDLVFDVVTNLGENLPILIQEGFGKIGDVPTEVLNDPATMDKGYDLPVEDPNHESSSDSSFGNPAIETCQTGQCWTDPVGGDGIDSDGSGALNKETGDGGDDIFDPLGDPSPDDAVDLCALGHCLDPAGPEVDKAGDDTSGGLDNCQLSATCETGDDSGEKEEKCEQSYDGSENCSDSPPDEDEDDSADKDDGRGEDQSNYGKGCQQGSAECEESQYNQPPIQDSDGDGVPDAVELAGGTEPDNPDSDGDGLQDGFELFQSDSNPSDTDTDDDGVWDDDEFRLGTDPREADSDGDGWNDLDEIVNLSDPTNGDITPYDGILSVNLPRCLDKSNGK